MGKFTALSCSPADVKLKGCGGGIPIYYDWGKISQYKRESEKNIESKYKIVEVLQQCGLRVLTQIYAH